MAIRSASITYNYYAGGIMLRNHNVKDKKEGHMIIKMPEAYYIDMDERASIEWLQQQMECAIKFENYERAAQLRDKIKERDEIQP